MFDYDRRLLLSSIIEDVCCGVIYVPLHPVNESFFFVGLLLFGVCGILFNVLSRSVFSFFPRGSLDETLLLSVNFAACMVRILSFSRFVHSIVFYVECRHTIFVQTRGIFILALITFFL